MRKTIHILFAAALIGLALAGHSQLMLYIALAGALAEACALFAPEMYFVSAVMELDDSRRSGLWRTALLLGVVGAALATLLTVVVGLSSPVPAIWLLVLLIAVRLRVRPGGGKHPFFVASLLRAFPEAFLLRGVYLVPALALLAGAWYGWGVNTLPAYAAGLLAFSALRVENRLSGAEIERFGVRWVFGALATAICALLGWNGVFSAVYCAWGVIAALLPVQRNGRAWLSALLVGVQAVCGYLAGYGLMNGWIAAAAALALTALLAAVQARAIYAAWLPVRAWFIRRRARR